ncbi:MAG: hypothetical protein MUE51_10095, partial [Thermoleophilia bacterium]|nr:hypothetical protein [Thermoleophilia bacterium]
ERAVGDDALALLGGMHRHVEGPVADLCPVRVFALPGAVGVAGELDVFAVPLLERLLQMTAPAGTLDLGGLRFVDHHGLAAVAAHLDRHPGMRIARLSPVARRLAALTGITLPGG